MSEGVGFVGSLVPVTAAVVPSSTAGPEQSNVFVDGIESRLRLRLGSEVGMVFLVGVRNEVGNVGGGEREG